MGLKQIFGTIISGYYQKGKSLLVYALFIAAALFLSVAVVYPLWYFATENPRAYTYFCFVLAGLGLAAFIIHKSLQAKKREILPENLGQKVRRRRAFWASLGKVLLTLICLYILFRQFSSGSVLRGIILAAVFFFLLGWLYFGKSSNGKKNPKA